VTKYLAVVSSRFSLFSLSIVPSGARRQMGLGLYSPPPSVTLLGIHCGSRCVLYARFQGDFVLVSAHSRELPRIQHGFTNWVSGSLFRHCSLPAC
jgi:hypothetical protein